VSVKSCVTAGCAGVIVLLGAAVALVVGAAILFREVTPPGPNRFVSRPGAWRFFTRADEGPRFRLRYGFVDYSGRRREVTCSIEKDAVRRAERQFGWDHEAVAREIEDLVKEAIGQELLRRGLNISVRFRVEADGSWTWNVPPVESDEPRVHNEVGSFVSWMRTDLTAIHSRVEAEVFARRGLRLRRNRVEIDYNTVARGGSEDLRDCHDALVRAMGATLSERAFIGLLVAFLQELRYELPPAKVGQRDIFGFWVPAQVMTLGKGDCDSKAAVFASLWRHHPSRVIVILVPGHALVGVEARPGPGERFVRLGNRYYVLCEVAGPAKIPPGRAGISGSFEYVAIDPVVLPAESSARR
jgi:hypothetical protein